MPFLTGTPRSSSGSAYLSVAEPTSSPSSEDEESDSEPESPEEDPPPAPYSPSWGPQPVTRSRASSSPNQTPLRPPNTWGAPLRRDETSTTANPRPFYHGHSSSTLSARRATSLGSTSPRENTEHHWRHWKEEADRDVERHRQVTQAREADALRQRGETAKMREELEAKATDLQEREEYLTRTEEEFRIRAQETRSELQSQQEEMERTLEDISEQQAILKSWEENLAQREQEMWVREEATREKEAELLRQQQEAERCMKNFREREAEFQQRERESEGTGDALLTCSDEESEGEILNFIYQSLFALISSTAGSRFDRAVLNAYYKIMCAEDSASAIVNSRNWRRILVHLATDHGLSQDNKLREALEEDQGRLVASIAAILTSEPKHADVLKLEGVSAQNFLDVVQDILDKGLLDLENNLKARRMIFKLSKACDKLPSSLFITGITGREEHASFRGGFGDIYQASYEQKRVAIKHLRMFQGDAEQRRIRLRFCREVLVWQRLQHRYILPLIGIDGDAFPSSLCLVSPWMVNGTVLKYLSDYGRHNVDKMLSEIAQGLQYLHSQNIVHGDLRGTNILITNDWCACLADFGLTSFSDATATHTTGRAGSTRWMAPELIAPERFGRRFLRTPATDVYAFGCVCLELYTGRQPLVNLTEAAVLLKVIEGGRPERPTGEAEMSEVLWDLVNECWQQDSEARPLSEELVERLRPRG